MKIDVRHIAKLARLGLEKEDEKKLEKELSAILDFVEKLSEVDTKNIEPTAHITGAFDVLREDETNELSGDESVKKEILKNAPREHKGFYKVKRILE